MVHRDMSGTRGTVDLQSIKTQQLALQNPDGSFPPLGVVLGVVDDVGSIAPVVDISINSLTADDINITGFIYHNSLIAQTIVAEDVNVHTFSSGALTAYDVSATEIRCAHLYSADTNAGTVVASSVSTDYGSAERTVAGATNVTTADVGVFTTSSFTSPTATFTDISAGSITTTSSTINHMNATDAYASYAYFNDISSYTAGIVSLVSQDVSANTIVANSVTVSQLTTKNVSVSGAFTFNNIDLNSLEATNVVAYDISANRIIGTSATFRDVSATTFNIHNLEQTGTYTAARVNANTYTTNSLITPALTGATLAVSGTANLVDISAASVSSVTPSTTNIIAGTNKTSVANVTSSIRLGSGGVIKYTSELMVNDVSASSMYLLTPPLPFSSAYLDNNLATVTNIKSTLASTVNLFNNFMGQFSSRGIVVDLSPKLIFNSTMSMQFRINGVVKVPVVFAAGAHSLNEIIGALNAVCSPGILFSVQNTSGSLWKTTITISPTGAYYIADYTNTPTASLELLRWLGFSIYDRNNPFEIYNDNNICVPQLLAGSYISSEFSMATPLSYPSITPNNPQFSYVFSYENNGRYRITISLPTYSGINYQLISFNNSQTLYNSGQGSIVINNLLPATLYPYTMFYMDDYNISLSASTMLSVPVLPAPGVAAVPAPTFNSISLSIRSYGSKFEIDAVGPYIPSRTIVTGSVYTFNNLVQSQLYSFTVYSLDSSGNNIISLPGTITITTPSLTPPNLSLRQIRTMYSENDTGFTVTSNTLYNLFWYTYLEGTTGTLYYRINGGSTITHPLQYGDISYNIPSPLTGTGDISCSLVFTDAHNTVNSVADISYSSSFGLYNLTSSGSNLVLNGTTTRLGYSCMTLAPAGALMTVSLSAGGPWVGYTFSSVKFPQAITVVSASVQIVARVYILPYMVYANPNSQNQNIIISNISIPVASSDFTLFQSSTSSSSLSPGVYNNISLTFTPAITLTANMVVMFEIDSGAGSVEFATYTSTDESVTGYGPRINYLPNIATGLSYDGTNLTNTYATRSHNGVPCQFVY